MADLTSDELTIKGFCNDKVRPNCDKDIQNYKDKKVVLTAYLAVADKVPHTDDFIEDDSDKDARLRISGNQVHARMARIATDCAEWEADNNERLSAEMKIAVNY